MKRNFYPRLAWSGIRKNRTLYLPYIMTCVLVVAVFYILSYLSNAQFMEYMHGGSSTSFVLHLGSFVIAVFSVLFLFYTNSFLIRRRKKEFGLYNVLGMNKWNIARILLWETVIIAFAALAVGLVIGIALSKMAELALVNIIGCDIRFSFSVPPKSIGETAELYGIIFVLILLNSLRQVHFSNPTQLMRAEHYGEKAPKANWILGILGLVLLGTAYYLAVSIENPLDAFVWFFVAVILVILGTYLLFVAGSVLLCKILQKNKKYYYHPDHYVSVSSMAFRMKRNGAGLASICILATMVLVMISSSACLYFGAEDSLRSRYPRDFSNRVDYYQYEDASPETMQIIREAIGADIQELGYTQEDILDYQETHISAFISNGKFYFDPETIDSFNLDMFSDILTLYFVSLSEYNQATGANETLSDGEALLYSRRYKGIPDDVDLGGQKLHVVKRLDSFEVGDIFSMEIVPSVYFIVPDLSKTIASLQDLTDSSEEPMLRTCWYLDFNTEADKEAQYEVAEKCRETMRELSIAGEGDIYAYNCVAMEEERNDFYGTYGGLFFIGILLSIVFLVAAVLIIYYKQLSEGYEDQSRFHIMQRIGMTKKEIRRSINSQMLTVFLLPLVFSVLHLAFAFPMIRKLLMLFNLNNLVLLLLTTGISIACFALFYMVVYRMTSNVYYRIVSGGEEKLTL